MSVKVSGISKEYGSQIAVNNLSFEAKSGEVLGFLGPNGAGKSTTMKMINGFVTPTKGTIEVEGLDLHSQPLAVKSKIGYLPENNPLYLDMYIREYLLYVASLYKIENKLYRVNEVLEMTGLLPEKHKKIVQLSKGYRQRVGLAQALVHNPSVLILDEPTSGLDPNQLQDIRALIKELGRTKTVIFSTHIMQEVEAVCDRILIIHQGNIVANDTISSIQGQREEKLLYKVKFGKAIPKEKISEILGVVEVTEVESDYLIKANREISEELFNLAVKHQTYLEKNQRESFSLENIFRELTAK